MKRILEVIMAAAVLVATTNVFTPNGAKANNCKDVKVIWTNGSGATINGTDNNYLDFRAAVTGELKKLNYSFDFYELGSEAHGGYQYPAAGIGIESLKDFFTMIGAWLSAGQSYNYGRSVEQGVKEMQAYISEVKAECPKTKFVLGGLSQGGQVTSTALEYLNPKDIIYVATFGDPKLYLPEGVGVKPAACVSEDSFSEYRVYVPDCHAHDGILEGRKPNYQFPGYSGKLGVWCNWHDVVCSSYINLLDLEDDSFLPHGSYGNTFHADHLYDDAAKVIREKVKSYFAGGEKVALNVAILIDTTESMTKQIALYKAEAMKLANQVWEKGGDVALFEYRDLKDPFLPVMRCGYTADASEKCTPEVFQRELNSLMTSGGSNVPESLLSASLYTMNTLKWKDGADKAIVVLTDAGYHPSEVYQGSSLTLKTIVDRSYEIDPVIFYTITPKNIMKEYASLTSQTGGRAFDINEELEFSTQYILNDVSTIRTGVLLGAAKPPVPTISNVQYEADRENGSVKISFSTDAAFVLVKNNGALVGTTREKEITISDIDFSQSNTIELVPYPEKGYAGEAYIIDLDIINGNIDDEDTKKVPKAPNSGMVGMLGLEPRTLRV